MLILDLDGYLAGPDDVTVRVNVERTHFLKKILDFVSILVGHSCEVENGESDIFFLAATHKL